MVAPTLDPGVFLKSIEQQTGLVLERELGIYSFAHKTFQEYLASMYILEKNLGGELYDRINDDWWHEVIKLFSAQTHATKIITVCLDQDPPSSVALSLAIQCLEEAKQVKPELRDIAERILMENAEDNDPEIRNIIGQALLSNRLKHLSALSPTVFIDTKLVTNAEYQIFIDEMLLRGGADFHPVHWKSKSFAPGTGHNPVIGLTPKDSLGFCEWLTILHAGSGEWYFRLPTHEEIEHDQYLDLPGFWMLQANTYKGSNNHELIEIWENPKFPWKSTPTQLIRKVTQDDIRNILSSLRNVNKNIDELKDNFYTQLSKSLKTLVNTSSKSDQLLTETADLLYHAISNEETERPVDFGYGMTDLETYDQGLRSCPKIS